MYWHYWCEIIPYLWSVIVYDVYCIHIQLSFHHLFTCKISKINLELFRLFFRYTFSILFIYHLCIGLWMILFLVCFIFPYSYNSKINQITLVIFLNQEAKNCVLLNNLMFIHKYCQETILVCLLNIHFILIFYHFITIILFCLL